MYRINTIPGEAAKEKGHASYPEDFPHLRPGEDFTAFMAGEHWEIETTLNGAALEERLRVFAKQTKRLIREGAGMIFIDDTHAEQWAEAIDRAGAHRDDDTVNSDFGASLFIITGLPGLYPRLKRHIHKGFLDIEAMLGMGLSTGESVLVALAGNLYNGGFFDRYTPLDIVSYCDAGTTELAAKALLLRKQRVDINTIFD